MVTSEYYEVVCKQSDEAAWKAARWEGWSASIMPALMSSFYPAEYYDKYAEPAASIVANHARRINTVKPNGFMSLGRHFEAGVISWANEVHGEKLGAPLVSWGELIRSKATPYLLATPDATNGKQLGEVKTHTYKSRAWHNGVPAKVLVQANQQMYCAGIDEAWVIDWGYPAQGRMEPEPPNVTLVHRDEECIRKILRLAEMTWEMVLEIRKREEL